ncbi:DUF924 family protein [Aeromonas veronii]
MQPWQPLPDLWFGELAQAAAEQGGTPAQATFAGFAGYTCCHRVTIACVGRFPHRNDIPGCTSMPEEVAFLQ